MADDPTENRIPRSATGHCDQIALDAAKKIEAIFDAEHKGGATQRRARIQIAVIEAIKSYLALKIETDI